MASSGKPRRWRRIAAIVPALLLVLGASAYLGVSYVAAARYTSDYPRAPVLRAPAVDAAYEDVSFRTSDGLTLRGWFFPVSTDRVVALLPGREDDRTWSGRFERVAGFLIGAGYSVLMFDMRGHGSSDGERYTMGHFERFDVVAAIDFLRARRFSDRGIALLGISMGAATELAMLPLRPDIGPMIVDSSYVDLPTVMRENLEAHFGLPAWFVPGILVAARIMWGVDETQIRPLDVVRSHPERSFLFIQCDADEWVLPYQAQRLRAASANAASELWLAPGCGHVGAVDEYPAEYQSRVLAFLAREFERPAATTAPMH